MKKTVLQKYAKLIAVMGVNVQKGQEIIIYAELDQPEFVKMLVKECYVAGASKVRVEWDYQPLTKLHVKYRSLKTLSSFEDWEIEKYKYITTRLPARIHLVSADPDGLVGMDQTKFSKAVQAKHPVIKPFIDEAENKYQWCIAAVPGEAWAKKVFPAERKALAVEKLWKAIIETSRVDEDPIAAWQAHNRDFEERRVYLDRLNIETLHYTAKNGTDLKVGLIEDSRFLGGGETTLGDVFFNPNIPSEEVFISPKKGAAEGIVYATKPLSYRGQLIENFSVRFENGRAVDVRAEKNEELLKTMITMDESAACLGECAFVPYDSPISNAGILFYETLFDENAACHLALGRGFPNCIRDYEKYTLEECRAKGINDSMIHVDFMIGSADLCVTGITRDGKEAPIFKDGNWAF